MDEAEAQLLSRLAEVEAASGDGVEVDAILRQLGQLYANSARLAEAVDVYRQVVGRQAAILGEDDPEAIADGATLAGLLHDLAVLQVSTGHEDEARCLWLEAKATLGDDLSRSPGS